MIYFQSRLAALLGGITCLFLFLIPAIKLFIVNRKFNLKKVENKHLLYIFLINLYAYVNYPNLKGYFSRDVIYIVTALFIIGCTYMNYETYKNAKKNS